MICIRSSLLLLLGGGLLAACNPAPGAEGPAGPAESTGGSTAASTTAAPLPSTDTSSGESSTNATAPDPTFTTAIPGTDSSSGGSNTPMPEEVDYEFCELDWEANANVVGTTPNGPFNGQFAWFGWLTCNGDGLSPTLILLEDPAELAAAVAVSPSGDALPTPSIEWYLFGACSPAGGWVGEGNVTVYMRTDGPWHQAGGQIEIFDTHRIFDIVDPDDPPRMHGFISIHEGEWDIEGEFTAAYCGPLSYPLGCE